MDTISVRELRRGWKPHKERLAAASGEHPTAVRFHRACSWLDQAQQLDAAAAPDLALILQWIALNALYGQWNGAAHEPAADRQAWKAFLARVLAIDGAGRLRAVLVEHKRLVVAILGNAYLNRHFWSEPSEAARGRLSNGRHRVHGWYVEGRWLAIAEEVLERIYLVRCQLVHGASTLGSRLNRDALRHCTTMLGHLVPAILRVWIDGGADEDWGPLCYPPMHGARRAAK